MAGSFDSAIFAAFKRSEIEGKFKIKPVSNSNGNQVTVTITAPDNQIWQAIDAVSKANVAPSEPVKPKKKPKAPPPESDSLDPMPMRRVSR